MVSSLGFDKESIEILKSYDKSLEIQGMNLLESSAIINNELTLTSLFYELDLNNTSVNKLQLLEGKYREKPNEILVEQPSYFLAKEKETVSMLNWIF